MKVYYRDIRVKSRPYEQMDDYFSADEIKTIVDTRIWYSIMRGIALRNPDVVLSSQGYEMLVILLRQVSWKLSLKTGGDHFGNVF